MHGPQAHVPKLLGQGSAIAEYPGLAARCRDLKIERATVAEQSGRFLGSYRLGRKPVKLSCTHIPTHPVEADFLELS